MRIRNVFNFLSEISIFKKLLIFAWHGIALLCRSVVKHQRGIYVICAQNASDILQSVIVDW